MSAYVFEDMGRLAMRDWQQLMSVTWPQLAPLNLKSKDPQEIQRVRDARQAIFVSLGQIIAICWLSNLDVNDNIFAEKLKTKKNLADTLGVLRGNNIMVNECTDYLDPTGAMDACRVRVAQFFIKSIRQAREDPYAPNRLEGSEPEVYRKLSESFARSSSNLVAV